jgi:gluconolactonase
MTPLVLSEGHGFLEGPVCLPDGGLAFVDMANGVVIELDGDGALRRRHRVGGGPNGLAVDSDGRLYVAQNGGIWAATEQAEPGIQIIDDGHVDYLATGLDAPNDVVFGPDGNLWVTDSRGEANFVDPGSFLPGRVFRVDPANGCHEIVVEGPRFINGIGFDSAGTTLYVTATAEAAVLACRVSDDIVGEPAVVHRLQTGYPDGLAVDRDDQVWVATTAGDSVLVIDAAGNAQFELAIGPGTLPTNIALVEVDDRVVAVVTAAHTGQVIAAAPNRTPRRTT